MWCTQNLTNKYNNCVNPFNFQGYQVIAITAVHSNYSDTVIKSMSEANPKSLNQISQELSTGLRLKWLIRKIIIYWINISLKINILPRRSTRGDLYRCCSNNKIRYIRSKRPQGSPKSRAHIFHSFYEIPFCNQTMKNGYSPKILDFSVFFSWWFEIFSDFY